MTTDRIGQQLGNYAIIQLLGQGGFADVYLGEHIYLKSQAAVKVLQARLASGDDMDSFLKEAQTIARLFHPHIIRIMDFGVAAETPFLVMDYAPKGTLRQKHLRGTPVPLSTVIPYVKQVAGALQYAHDELRLIHRDIKPENMLIGRRDEILLSDFGIALVAQSSRYQGTQDVIGTVAYMAPEQIQGRPHAASDQYSLAVVVYEWLTGDRPFHGSFTEMCTQHIFAPPPPLLSKVPSLPSDVNLVVMQALAKSPQQRFENIQAFASALEQAALSRGGERTEQLQSTFNSRQISDTIEAASYPPTIIPVPLTNTPSFPQYNNIPAQPPAQPTRPGQFLAPQASANMQAHAQTNARENFTLPAQPQNQSTHGSPTQTPQKPLVLPSTPEHTPHYSARPDYNQQSNQFSSSYPPRSYQQPLRTEAPQQQVMAPQRSLPEPHYDNTPAHTDFGTQPSHEPTKESQHIGSGTPTFLLRPLIAIVIGIVLFCAAAVLPVHLFGRQILLSLAVPLFFGAAFGPIVGLLVGVGGIFGLTLILPAYSIPFYIDYPFLHQNFAVVQPFLINGLPGFMAGLSMLKIRRYPGIGSSLRGVFLGGIGLFGSIIFIFYRQFGFIIPFHSFVNIAIAGAIDVIVAFALLVVYSIIGRLLDPS